MARFLIASSVLLALISSCGHLPVNDGADRAVAEVELDAALSQVELARQLVAAGAPAGAAQAYRAALELIPAGELPDEFQDRANDLADAILEEYHALLSTMPSLPDETPAWAVVAEMDSTDNGVGTFSRPSDSGSYDMPVVMNDKVSKAITYFTTKGRKPFTVWLERMGMYEGIIREILHEHGLPQDLIYLAMIESGFNTRAQSYARAVGPWQFISGTARKYGLRVTWWVDERRDIVKSTHAACRYLKALHEQFGSWELAMASYNCGEGKVERHIKTYKTNDFWKLTKLPRQTRNYVPTFMAATIIAKSPEQYGFFVEPLPALTWDEVELEECASLDVVAQCAGSSVEELELLNAELRKRCTPPDERYVVRVPVGTAGAFREEYAKIPDDEKVTWAHHRVTRGQTLSLIARRYGTTVQAIKEFNGLKSTHLIREGTDLVIPVPRGATAATSPVHYSGEQTTYRVRRGDTLGRIAGRCGASVRQLCQWNGLAVDATIYPGQTLHLWPEATLAGQAESRGGSASPDSSSVAYAVRPGDTLSGIADLHGVSVDAIRRANGISGSRIYAGQQLLVPGAAPRQDDVPSQPGSDRGTVTLAEAAAPGGTSAVTTAIGPPTHAETPGDTAAREHTQYTVRRGDTLSRIADRHGMTIAALQGLNGIRGTTIYPGQSLVVSGAARAGGGEGCTHTVLRGESLARIAAKYGVTVEHLRRVNGIRGSLIHPGQRLEVPSRDSAPRERLVYTVRRGDSLSAIARRFGVTIAELESWNGISRRSVLFPGTALTIHSSLEASDTALGG